MKEKRQGHISMSSKAVKRRIDVRETILREATRLFGERGFGGVALRDIAKACDIQLSTLSSHFARKLSLQEAVFQRAVQIIIKRSLPSRLGIGSPKQRFRRYLAKAVELTLSDLPEMKVLNREFQELDKPSTFNIVVRTFGDRATMDSLMFLAKVAKDTNSGILKSISAVRLIQMAFASIYGIVKLRSVHRHVVGARAVSKAAITRDITLMFERMLRT
jgi:AcrR family transcriptional regulator